jgi:ribosomal protein S12 methylthiotransferase accessory factor
MRHASCRRKSSTPTALCRHPQANFLGGSNGLAAGNHLAEALLSALCEAIERDAVALWNRESLARRAARRVDPASIDDAGCQALLELYRRAGVAVRIWDVTSDIGVATFVCDIPATAEEGPDGVRMRGGGCHPARAVALSRALTEAAQTRLNYIVGARDSISGTEYAPTLEARTAWALLDMIRAPAASFAAAPDFASDDLAADLRAVLVRLRGAGLRHAVAVDLTAAEIGIPVVRVVVPGLEWDCNHPKYRPAGAH